MSDCDKCWDTPCSCGWDYGWMNEEQRIKQAAAVLGVSSGYLAEKLGNNSDVSGVNGDYIDAMKAMFSRKKHSTKNYT